MGSWLFCTRAVYLVSVITISGAVFAQQDYPTRPVRMVVAYPPGGSNDYVARVLAPRMTEIFGRQVVVDNRGGGNTIIGTDAVAKSTPDGHTMLLSGSSQVTIPHLYRTIPYDIIKDFAPVAGVARSEFLLVVHPAVQVTSVRDLIELAKKRPGELNYATSSTGGGTHLSAVLFQMLTGVKMQQVPYKGGGPAMADLIAGQVQLGFANPGSVVPIVQVGRLRAVAVTGEKRLDALPQTPTFAEAGLPGLIMRNWYAVNVPASTPKALVDRLSAVVLKVVAMPEVKSALVKQGMESYSATAAEIDVIRREDWAIVAKVIKAANIKVHD